jgi:DNA-binding SARP family transcriptional activator
MTRLSLTLLGDFQARFERGAPLRLRTRKAQALLAYLARSPGEPHSRDKLAALLWGERPLAHARGRLRESLFVLRRTLSPADPPCLAANGEAVVLAADTVDVDVISFERLVRADSPQALEDAVGLYRGDFLEGLGFRGALFEEWLMTERERLREAALGALAKLLVYQGGAGKDDAALQTALRLIGLEPLQEAVHRTLMRLYARLGRRGEALRQYQICVGTLRRHLGVEPEAETRKLYQEILRRRPTSPRRAGGEATSAAAADVAALPASVGTLTSRLIGRDHEMTRMRAWLAEARAGRGQLVVSVGEAGIGKTRLVDEVAIEALQHGARVLVGRCHESDQILAFGPWVQAFRAGNALFDDEVLGGVSPVWRAELARLLPELAAPGLPPPSGTDLRLFEGMAHVVARLASRRLLILVLEDLQWADEMTLRLLAFVGRRLHRWRVFILATTRDDELSDAPVARRALEEIYRESLGVRLTLLPLSRRDTMELVWNLARPDRDVARLDDVQETAWRVSEGNPFVVTETVRALQQGEIVPESGMLPLPQRVRDLIAGRLERLTEQARHLAAVAAVSGREVGFSLLAHASGLDEATTAEGVEELVRRRVLHGVGEQVDFTHDRVRAVVSSQLLPMRRRLLHRRVGEAIEAIYVANLEPHTLRLGQHYLEGEVWEKAALFLWQSGVAAAGRSAYREAVACFEQALGALDRSPDSTATIRDAIDVRFELQAALVATGAIDRVIERLREAETLAARLRDQRRLARVWAHIAYSSWWTGQPHDAVEFGERALAVAQTVGDLDLEALANFRLGQAYDTLGRFQRAGEVLQRNSRLFDGELGGSRGMPAVHAVACRAWWAQGLAALGDFAAAQRIGAEACQRADISEHGYSRILAYQALGHVLAVRGDNAGAIAWLDRAMTLCREHGIAAMFPVTAARLGLAYASSGRVGEALPLLQQSVALTEAMKLRANHVRHVVNLAEGYLLAGLSDEALGTIERGIDLCRVHQQRRYEGDALRVLGDVLGHEKAPAAQRAEAAYHAAIACADALGMRPLLARCRLSLGRLYQKTGRLDAAREALQLAAEQFQSMEMTSWAAQAEAALATTRDQQAPFVR